jgi:predicted Zn-dependent protease
VGEKGLSMAVEMALGRANSEVATLAAGLAGKTAMLAYGRDMELEADQFGARYSSAAGYDPRALGTFFEKLKAKYGDAGPVMTFFSTHPATSDRITRVNAYVTEQNLTGRELGTAELKAVQARLGKK